eukprot:CAMPEP_0116025378 /NCGR_PEP_ID=MMETSP0321-20121206/13000_1 /TAXON_ID=163516 /ORGANISM="Leptocylindrus danicus var. danicus, Strain B650" /LENGTH=254 /DNA_ID=CAMNT_0003497535 /DNA_START=79 /DNA_END=843 /DNA_ORIENTATION=+
MLKKFLVLAAAVQGNTAAFAPPNNMPMFPFRTSPAVDLRPDAMHVYKSCDRVISARNRVSNLKATSVEKDQDSAKNRPKGTPDVFVINSTNDLIDFLSKDDRLCIIKFHAKWCKSCQKFGLRYEKLASAYADILDRKDKSRVLDEGKVRFAEVEFSANAKMCRTLGIKRLPYVHFYRGAEGRLAEFAAGPSKFNLVVDKLNELLSLSQEQIDFNIMMEDGENLGKYLVTELKNEHWDEALADADGKVQHTKAEL